MKKILLGFLLFCFVNPLLAANDPYIITVNPTGGAAFGGNTVVITGKDLNANPVVYFGSNTAVIVTSTYSAVTCIAPAGSGAVSLFMVSNGIATNQFTYTYFTGTNTPTPTATSTVTNTPTATPTATVTNTPTNSPTYTVTNTPTNTVTNTPTVTPSPTPTPQQIVQDAMPVTYQFTPAAYSYVTMGGLYENRAVVVLSHTGVGGTSGVSVVTGNWINGIFSFSGTLAFLTTAGSSSAWTAGSAIGGAQPASVVAFYGGPLGTPTPGANFVFYIQFWNTGRTSWIKNLFQYAGIIKHGLVNDNYIVPVANSLIRTKWDGVYIHLNHLNKPDKVVVS